MITGLNVRIIYTARRHNYWFSVFCDEPPGGNEEMSDDMHWNRVVLYFLVFLRRVGRYAIM